MKNTLIFIILLLSSLQLFAQNKPIENPPTSSERYSEAREYAKVFVDGILLVRLKSNKNKINALKKYRGEEAAQLEQLKQDKINKEIINSFKTYYSISKVYFFYSEYSKQVRNKEFDKVSFVDENLNVDESIDIDAHNEFLIAEFSSNKQRSGLYRHGSYMKRDETGVQMVDTYWGPPAIRFSALIIMNDKFEQLAKPLPRYVRTYESIPFLRRSKPATISRLNQKVGAFLTWN